MQMPAAVLLDAILADAGSAVVGIREFMAGEKFFSDAGSLYPGNALIQDMLRNVDLPKLEETVRPLFSLGNLKAVHAECQRRISDGLAVLANDAEANQFKAFLVALADKVLRPLRPKGAEVPSFSPTLPLFLSETGRVALVGSNQDF
jgi:hypothetical protein